MLKPSMERKPLIMISNDDGIESPGLHAAAEALLPLADILIVAPAEQQSGTGRSFYASPNAGFQQRDVPAGGQTVPAWCLAASPATTVRHALQCLVNERKPDMVVSGINYGDNLGSDITSSGTVGAAIQSAVWDYKSLAVSFEVPPEFHHVHGKVDWSAAISILRRAAECFLRAQWPEDVHILKIDIPDTADENTPWRVTRQSREPGWWGRVPNAHPAAPENSTVGQRGPRPGHDWEKDSDAGVVLMDREVSVTPLSLDMTSEAAPADIAAMFE